VKKLNGLICLHNSPEEEQTIKSATAEKLVGAVVNHLASH